MCGGETEGIREREREAREREREMQFFILGASQIKFMTIYTYIMESERHSPSDFFLKLQERMAMTNGKCQVEFLP